MKLKLSIATLILTLIAVTACYDVPSADFSVDCLGSDLLVCSEKPGLSEGQRFRVLQDITLNKTSTKIETAYFINGQRLSSKELSSYEDEQACSLTLSDDFNDQKIISSQNVDGSLYTIPSLPTSYRISSISWYIDTVHFQGIDMDGNGAGFVVECGRVESGRINNHFLQQRLLSSTSLKAIQQHFKGYIAQE